jgi:hypothetical protein
MTPNCHSPETEAFVHRIAVPQRSDGVAHALHAIYDAAISGLPRDFEALLGKIDDTRSVSPRD